MSVIVEIEGCKKICHPRQIEFAKKHILEQYFDYDGCPCCGDNLYQDILFVVFHPMNKYKIETLIIHTQNEESRIYRAEGKNRNLEQRLTKLRYLDLY